MGFPSPAADYVAPRLSPEIICGIGIDSRILETSTGFAVIEPGHSPGRQSGSADPQWRPYPVCKSHGSGINYR